jgi:hypothetical protein
MNSDIIQICFQIIEIVDHSTVIDESNTLFRHSYNRPIDFDNLYLILYHLRS